jgi:probable rRNA maturation factor
VTLTVDVSYAARRPWVPRRAHVAAWALAAWAAETRVVAAPAAATTLLSVRVVGDAQSRRLNSQYRSKDKSTNVLSFRGMGRGPDGIDYLGELVICAPVVAREALAQGKARSAHWAHMMVHGVLHLLGFDHERETEARKMMAREVQILDRLGFSNPYA